MLTLFAIVVAAAIYLFFNQNIVFEQVFKYGQDYEQTSAEDVRIYVAPDIAYNNEVVFQRKRQI